MSFANLQKLDYHSYALKLLSKKEEASKPIYEHALVGSLSVVEEEKDSREIASKNRQIIADEKSNLMPGHHIDISFGNTE